MKRNEYYEFQQTYDYEMEIPYDGAEADGIDEADTVFGLSLIHISEPTRPY